MPDDSKELDETQKEDKNNTSTSTNSDENKTDDTSNESIPFESEIIELEKKLNTIDEAPINLSDNVEKLIESLNKIQSMMNEEKINKDDFNIILKDAKEAGEKVNQGFSVDKEIDSVEAKINSISDDKQKNKARDLFKKKLPFAKMFKQLENPLEKEVRETKASFDKNKDKHPVEFYEIATSLKEFSNMPNINAVFLGLESLAFSNKKNQINEILNNLDKVSTIVTLNLNRFLNEKLDPTKINEIFKKTTGKDIIEIFKDPKGIIEPDKFQTEFKQTDENLRKIALNVEEYKEMKYKPIYNKLLNFYWNAMTFYETMENKLTQQAETKNLANTIDGLGDKFAETYEKYAKLFNPDEIKNVVDYVNRKIELFKKIYDMYYIKVLHNYIKILKSIEDKDTGIKKIIIAIANAELNDKDEEKKLEEIKSISNEISESFEKIEPSKEKVHRLVIPSNTKFKEIEEDIEKRLGKIELIDQNSIKIFSVINGIQREVISDINKFIIVIKQLWSDDYSLSLNGIIKIKKNYSELIKSLKSLNEIYHIPIIKHYKNNVASINKFIDNFDLMYGIKDNLENKRIEENKEIIQARFDLRENDLNVIKKETITKQAINNYFSPSNPEIGAKINKALEALNKIK
jgi:hypothetical protein